MDYSWGILANLPLRLCVDKAATATIRLCGASTPDAGCTITAKFSSKTEKDRGQEEAGHGGPSETHEIATNVGFLIGRAKGITTLDNPDTVTC
jgi:hypothetical protein